MVNSFQTLIGQPQAIALLKAAIDPLTKAADAIEIITDGLSIVSIEQVIGKIIDLYLGAS